jgi:hypothetical protein
MGVTPGVKRRTANWQAVSRKVEVIELRKHIVGKDDVIYLTEVYMAVGAMARQWPLPRGLRAWHVGYSEYVATRETLDLLAEK